ncbi:cytochrome P450 [Phlegmacium glaucopus]|nr:cytochrome P450 [Phlegmacium glaucopus]
MSALWTVAGVGLIVHLIFKRTETFRFFWLFILLLATPASLTVFYLPYVNNIIQAALTVFGLFWSTLTISILVYRVSPWHPLAKYPGPLLCKLTKFHLAFIALRRQQHIYYSQLHKTYGDVVRIGPNELSICNVDAVTPLMGPNGLEKGPFWSGRVPAHESVQPLIAIVDKVEHARRRRSWTRAFSTAALKGYEAIIKYRSLQLIDTLSSQNLKEQIINLTQWFAFYAYDVTIELAFGGGSEMMRDGDPDGRWHTMEGGQREAVFMSHVPWLGSIALSLPGFAKDLKFFRAHAQNWARRRVQEGSTHKDLFYHLIDEDNLATFKPTLPEVISDAALAVLAGSDTTSSAITNIFYFLISNPTVYKRLQAEIDGLGDSLTDCTAQSQLPYLNAVIHEGLRLLPSLLSGVQRAAVKGTGGKMIGSVYLPEGNFAFVHTYSLQRDPRCFSPLPDAFIPERWLPEDQRQVLEPKIFNSQTEFIHNTAAFIPFSVGPANCAGKSLAWMEMRMVVTLMTSRFDLAFEPSYNPQKWYDDLCDYFITVKGQLPARLSVRKA